MIVIVFTAFSLGVGFLIPRRSGMWIAALAWPLAEWLGVTGVGVSNPKLLLVVPAAFCAMSAYACALVRRRTTLIH